jgi:hypothetical protein
MTNLLSDWSKPIVVLKKLLETEEAALPGRVTAGSSSLSVDPATSKEQSFFLLAIETMVNASSQHSRVNLSKVMSNVQLMAFALAWFASVSVLVSVFVGLQLTLDWYFRESLTSLNLGRT